MREQSDEEIEEMSDFHVCRNSFFWGKLPQVFRERNVLYVWQCKGEKQDSKKIERPEKNWYDAIGRLKTEEIDWTHLLMSTDQKQGFAVDFHQKLFEKSIPWLESCRLKKSFTDNGQQM